MSYCADPDTHIRDEVKVVLDLPNYATKKELKDAAGVDTSSLGTERRSFITLKAEVDKLDINKLANVSSSLSNLKTKVENLDLNKLKTVWVDFKKLGDVVSKEVVKQTMCNKLNTKVDNLENKTPDVTTLIHINQYNSNHKINN